VAAANCACASAFRPGDFWFRLPPRSSEKRSLREPPVGNSLISDFLPFAPKHKFSSMLKGLAKRPNKLSEKLVGLKTSAMGATPPTAAQQAGNAPI